MPTPAALPPPTSEPLYSTRPAGVAPRLARRIIGLAWPVLALNFLILTVDMSDRFLVGNLPAPTPEVAQARLAARGTAHYVAWFISSYTVLVSVGATALVAHCVGAGDWRTARRAAGQAIVLAAIVGLAGSIAGLACCRSSCSWSGLEGEAAAVRRRLSAADVRPAGVPRDRGRRRRQPGRGRRHADRPLGPGRRRRRQRAARLDALPRSAGRSRPRLRRLGRVRLRRRAAGHGDLLPARRHRRADRARPRPGRAATASRRRSAGRRAARAGCCASASRRRWTACRSSAGSSGSCTSSTNSATCRPAPTASPSAGRRSATSPATRSAPRR